MTGQWSAVVPIRMCLDPCALPVQARGGGRLQGSSGAVQLGQVAGDAHTEVRSALRFTPHLCKPEDTRHGNWTHVLSARTLLLNLPGLLL